MREDGDKIELMGMNEEGGSRRMAGRSLKGRARNILISRRTFFQIFLPFNATALDVKDLLQISFGRRARREIIFSDNILSIHFRNVKTFLSLNLQFFHSRAIIRTSAR